MTPDFHKQYRPLTSRPFLRGYAYSEYAPSGCLAPYIACFWEAGEVKEGAGERKVLVIPDTCADIIIHINYTRQTVSSRICGVADSPAVSVQKPSGDRETTFAVRFYFWAVRLFLNVKMSELYNQVLNLELVDKEAAGEFKALLDITETSGRIAWLERFLLNRLLQATVKRQCNFNVYNAVDRILKNSGSISVKEVCGYASISQRQMERLFMQDIGLSIKRTADLVRYQNVWCDVVRQDVLNIQDTVYRYGFADQSHLLNEFKRFHGVTPRQAKEIALLNL